MRLKEEQAAAFDLLTADNEDNFFITGKAGTGKTFLLSTYIKYLEDNNVPYLVCAPTGAAAISIADSVRDDYGIDICAATIHRTFGLSIADVYEKHGGAVRKEIEAADVIIIDEVSMCRIDLFDVVINEIIKANRRRNAKKSKRKNIKIVVCGDFFQLAPVPISVKSPKEVIDEWDARYGKRIYAFQSESWKVMDFKVLNLKEPVRTAEDRAFDACLDRLRTALNYKEAEPALQWIDNNSAQDSESLPSEPIILCGIRDPRRDNSAYSRNIERLRLLGVRPEISFAEVSGESSVKDTNAEDELVFAAGARVMMIVNNPPYYMNGSFGKIITVCGEKVLILIDGSSAPVWVEKYEWSITRPTVEYEEVIVGLRDDGSEVKEYRTKIVSETVGSVKQFPFVLAWAITVHKAQGKTIPAAEFEPMSFSYGMLYVALSRVKHASDIYLSEYLVDSRRMKFASPDVVNFYKKNAK